MRALPSILIGPYLLRNQPGPFRKILSSRNIVANDRTIHAKGWDRRLVAPVRGKTPGRIGQAVALRARAFGMKVVACDPLVDARIMEQFQIKRLGLDELVAKAGIISRHALLTEATRGLVNRQFLARMRPASC